MASKADVSEIAVDVAPFVEAAIIEELEFFGDDEGDNVVGEAFLEHYQAADSSVAVLEGVDAFELDVEVEDVFECFCRLVVVGLEQGFHFGVDLLGRACHVAAHFVGQALVVAHVEPVFAAVGGPGLEHSVELFDQGL